MTLVWLDWSARFDGSRSCPTALAVVLAQDAPKPHNAIIFVADGLRHGSVNPIDTPALYRVRSEGVHFANSHAVFPTQTMPNAAAIATGHIPVTRDSSPIRFTSAIRSSRAGLSVNGPARWCPMSKTHS